MAVSRGPRSRISGSRAPLTAMTCTEASLLLPCPRCDTDFGPQRSSLWGQHHTCASSLKWCDVPLKTCGAAVHWLAAQTTLQRRRATPSSDSASACTRTLGAIAPPTPAHPPTPADSRVSVGERGGSHRGWMGADPSSGQFASGGPRMAHGVSTGLRRVSALGCHLHERGRGWPPFFLSHFDTWLPPS